MVTLPLAGTPPFQVAVLVPTLDAGVPLVAVVVTRVRLAGRTSVSSFPAWSAVAEAPEFEMVMV